MTPLHLLLHFLFLLTISNSSTATVDGVPRRVLIPGGWSSIENISDPYIQELGAWAVREHDSQTHDSLVFEEVVSGESQVVAGTNYRLLLDAARQGVNGSYVAVIWEKTWIGFRQLTSFNSAQE